MFNVDGERLNISLDMGLDDIEELRDFLLPRIEYVEEIGIEGERNEFSTSSIIAFLASVKKSRPEIKIEIVGDDRPFGDFGILKWENNG